MTPLPHGKRTHIPELDGVRGIAVLLVMVYHFGGFYTSAERNPLASMISLAWSGVDLFFVLSGFLITTILVETRSDPHFFRNFYLRRGLRILPLYYAYVLFFAFVFLPITHHFHKFTEFHVGQLSLYWIHLSNWSSAWGALENSPIGHMWSLAIEEQFYFFWPLLVFLLPERILLLVCLALSAIAINLRLSPAMQAIHLVHTNFLYRLTPFRIETIAYGAIIALLNRQIHGRVARSLAGWACLISGFGLLWHQWSQGHTFNDRSLNMATFGYTAVGLCATGIVSLALRYEGSTTLYARLLRSSVLRAFGKYSYAMYIFHFGLGQYSYRAFHRFVGYPLMVLIVNCSFGIGLCFLLAKVSWKYFESPILALKDRIAGYRKTVDFEAATEEGPAPGLASV